MGDDNHVLVELEGLLAVDSLPLLYVFLGIHGTWSGSNLAPGLVWVCLGVVLCRLAVDPVILYHIVAHRIIHDSNQFLCQLTCQAADIMSSLCGLAHASA